MPPDARNSFSKVDDLKTLLRRKSSVKALCGKSSDVPFDKKDSKDTDLYGDSDKSNDGKTDENDDGSLYSDLFNEPPP